MNRWRFKITENGSWVAGGDCSDRDTALREAAHYAMQYGQDGGEVRGEVWEVGSKRRLKTRIPPKVVTGPTGSD